VHEHVFRVKGNRGAVWSTSRRGRWGVSLRFYSQDSREVGIAMRGKMRNSRFHWSVEAFTKGAEHLMDGWMVWCSVVRCYFADIAVWSDLLAALSCSVLGIMRGEFYRREYC